MAKLASVMLTRPFQPDADDRAINMMFVRAGVGRKNKHDEPITDIAIEDDPVSRRVWIRWGPGFGSERFVPYEHIFLAEPEPPEVAKPPPPSMPEARKAKR